MFGFISSKLLQESISGLTYLLFENKSRVSVQTRISACMGSSYLGDIIFHKYHGFLWNVEFDDLILDM
jgi:hypothetical protein